MSLEEYKNKRKFDKTPEPKGGSTRTKNPIFVIQKHDASRMHYDLRLQIEGALVSWAVPKGPSLDPNQKRLAIQVEDHPMDYQDFEGIIPEGNYGAGAVIVWDKGFYEIIEDKNKVNNSEAAAKKQWKKGHLKIVFKGKKLKGTFNLIRLKEENQWLLTKVKDKYADSEKDILDQEKSVNSGKTLNQIAKASSDSDKKKQSRISKLIADQPKEKSYSEIKPMLATLGSASLPKNTKWLFEVKWDGYRALSFCKKNKVEIKSRNNLDLGEKFPEIIEALSDLGLNAIFDGEIVALNNDGLPDFNALQRWQSDPKGNLCYYIFDILWYEGHDLKSLPLHRRQAILAEIIPVSHAVIRFSQPLHSSLKKVIVSTSELGLEGIMAKDADSIYTPDQRTKHWIKIKSEKTQEAIICGYTVSNDPGLMFGALLLAQQKDGHLVYVGRVGTGFSHHDQKELDVLFQKRKIESPPLTDTSEVYKTGRYRTAPKDITWLKPDLVCTIRYTEVTPNGLFRHPSFIALRTDKNADEAQSESQYTNHKNSPAMKKKSLKKKNEKTFKANGKSTSISNLDKVLWPGSGITKGDFVDYYQKISSFILPFLKDRPLSLMRFPNGIDGQKFFQKDFSDLAPDWMQKYSYTTDDDPEEKNYMLCNDRASLLFTANLVAELNPWSSKTSSPDHPSWCVIDLDPDKGNTFEQVIEVAQHCHQLLEDLSIPSYCKTSGSSGLHIYIPLGNQYTYDQSQMLARWLVSQIQPLLAFTSLERARSKRKGKIYLDFLQNRPGATLVAPYSVRAVPTANVSMPLFWEEVKAGLKPEEFNLLNAESRIKEIHSHFKKTMGRGINLKTLLSQIK